MKRSLRVLFATATALGLMACGGGGSGSFSTGGVYFTHSQLADEFVRRVNVDVAGYDLTLVKSNTLQRDYIVVYDWYHNSYDAYWLGAYQVGQNLYNYLVAYDRYFYYNLIPMGNNVYKDPRYGFLFSKVEGVPQDSDYYQSLREEVAIAKKAEGLRVAFGVSPEKAMDISRFAYHVKTAPAGTYSAADYDDFARNITGSTITEFQNAYKKGDLKSLATMIDKAGEISGMGAERAHSFVKDVFFSEN